jgi:hypothetical protein
MRALSISLKSGLIAGLALAAALPAAAATEVKAAPAAKASAATEDIRCLLTMVALSQDKQRQQAAQAGVYFFFGRLSTRNPGTDLTGAIKAEERKMQIKDLQAESLRCGPMVQNAGTILRATFAPPPGALSPGAPPAPAPALGPIPPAVPK